MKDNRNSIKCKTIPGRFSGNRSLEMCAAPIMRGGEANVKAVTRQLEFAGKINGCIRNTITVVCIKNVATGGQNGAMLREYVERVSVVVGG